VTNSVSQSGLQLRLDPWPADYESAVQFDELSSASAQIDPAVETAEWTAIPLAASVAPRVLYFVDGVRRVEARVLAARGGGMVHGLFGSTAVGCVRSADRQAVIDRVMVRRFLILGAGLHQSARLRIASCDLDFEGVSAPARSPMELIGELQNRMRAAEAQLGETLLAAESCVFVDGPLHYSATEVLGMVGVVKSIYMPYLDEERFALVHSLPPGRRTPLFLIRGGKNDRYSWYLRLARGRTIDHALAGIVRLEVSAAVGLEPARELAAIASSLLPRFASSPVRDLRAPQNLLPVGALEDELRRRMGDPLLIRRAIEKDLHRGLAA